MRLRFDPHGSRRHRKGTNETGWYRYGCDGDHRAADGAGRASAKWRCLIKNLPNSQRRLTAARNPHCQYCHLPEYDARLMVRAFPIALQARCKAGVKIAQDREANHVSAHHETAVEMAQRHVREGEKRITRQEAMVAELDRDNHPEAATLGRKVLETMRSSLDLMKRHLQAIEEQLKS